MKLFWVCFLAIPLKISSFLVNEKIVQKLNYNYYTGNFTIGKLPNGITTLNFEAKLKKTLNGKIMLKPQVFIVNGKNKRSVLSIPAINYCDVMRGHVDPLGVLKEVLNELKTYGNLLSQCPIKPDNYTMKGFYLDETASPITKMIRPNRLYMTSFTLTDENHSKIVQILSVQFYFTRNQSNWH